jgi:hypothetical protein
VASAARPLRTATDAGVFGDVASELQRLRLDYPHWAATLYRIRDKEGNLIPLRLNRVQRAIGATEAALLRARNRARIFVLKGRQGGITTDQQGRSLHQVWSRPGFDALTLADVKENTERIFEITRRALVHFPAALRPRTGDKETNEVSFPGLDTHFYTGTAGSARAGRGLTTLRLHGSEFALWEDPTGALAAALPSLVPTGHTVLLETTASSHGGDAHEFWLRAAANGLGSVGDNGYTALFFPWWDCDPLHYRLPLLEPDELGKLSDEELHLVRTYGLDLEQIKWRREEMTALTRSLFLREYAEDPESCWLLAGDLYYDAEALKRLSGLAPVPVYTDGGGALELFVTEAEWRRMAEGGDRAIGGADVSEGTGNDRNAAEFRSFKTDRPLAAYRSRSDTPEAFADVLAALGRRFASPRWGPALLNPEKNAHGITVIRRLVNAHEYPLARIYHRVSLEEGTQRPTPKLGWVTSEQSKPLMLDIARESFTTALTGEGGQVLSGVLRDAGQVHRDKTGKVNLTGKDELVAMMLAKLARTYPVQPIESGFSGVPVSESSWVIG